MKNKAPFVFYENTVALSFEKPANGKKLNCDFIMYGNSKHIANVLIEQMERHPEFAELITMAAFNYLERANNQHGIIQKDK